MQKQILLFLTLGLAGSSQAQSVSRQVIGSSGTSYADPSIQVDYSVGEAVTLSGTSGSFTISQGFQQNEENTSGIKSQHTDVTFSLYPNPAQNQITLSLNTPSSFGIRLSLTNIAGAVIVSDSQEEHVNHQYQRSLSLEGLASGVYFLNLFADNTLCQSIRFVKQ